MSDTEALADLVRSVNDCWLGGRYDDLARYLDPDMALAMPPFEHGISGRDAIIASYRDFGEKAAIRRFDTKPTHVDVVGPTAVTATRFEIDYALDGVDYSDTGTDILVFHRGDEGWRVVWRTMITP